MNRTNIINYIISKYNLETYLEIGVRDSNENFNLINIKEKDGVDPQPVTPVKYRVTSDEFFLSFANKKYDIIFVDGLHTYQQAYKDVINSLNFLNENGFIIMHDCDPPTEYHVRSYEEYLRTRGQWNGDVYKSFIRLKSELKDYNCFVVDIDFGCAVITKRNLGKKFKTLSITEFDISWKNFYENRSTYLDLVSFDEFKEIV